jgi:Cof subfamily protein (haloacid dehalogenase superfamily)
MRRIIFFDFDNTLYCHKTKRVPPSALKALGALRKEGHFLVLATGRGMESLNMINTKTDFVFDAYILLNGQVVIEQGSVVFERYINLQDSSALFTHADSLGVAYGGYTEIGQAVNTRNDQVDAVWYDFGATVPTVIPEFRAIKRKYLLQLYISEHQEGDFIHLISGYVTNRTHRYMISMIPQEAGKSIGITYLLKKHGFTQEQSIAFGDGYNDVDMLQSVGCGVAMEDGDSKLLAIADRISPAAEHDGIEHTLSALGLLHDTQTSPLS